MARLPAQAKTAAYTTKIVKPSPGDISEIFSGIQGEGPFVGERHLFIRLCGCPHRCAYCDTPQALTPAPECLVEQAPGSRKFKKIPNPVAPEKLLSLTAGFLPPGNPHRAIAITGGEPLWQTDYLLEVLPDLRSLLGRIYLETAGTHVSELKSVLEHIDVVAMDIKPPSATGLKPMWALHRDFLRVALAKTVVVKMIVTKKTQSGELELIRDMITEIDRTIPVVIQPVRPAWKVKSTPTIEQLMAWQAMLMQKLGEVRVIPQCQQLLGSL